MPCIQPLDAYRPAIGGPLKFSTAPPRDGRAYDKIQIPCGTCITCREEQARQWAVRITHEASQWEESSFVTLTYAPEHIPIHGSLDYQDLVKFWKRLRKQIGSLRYYAVGEYGDDSFRPHYHACIFGHAFTHNRTLIRETPTRLWTSPLLEEAWGLGQVSVGALNFQTARYTASYVTKKLKSKQQYVRVDEQTGELIKLVQPKPFMSRNIAKAWWTEWNTGVTAHDTVIINARPQKPPKAYDKWLGEVDPSKMKEIKDTRTKRAKRKPLTEAKARARAQNAHARTKAKNKSV